jgi:hypothetical protein
MKCFANNQYIKKAAATRKGVERPFVSSDTINISFYSMIDSAYIKT